MEATYMLNCDNCQSCFESTVAFPIPHLCLRCLIVYKAGEKQGIDKVLQWLSEQPKEDAYPDGGMYILVAVDKWQAKLKEWGL